MIKKFKFLRRELSVTVFEYGKEIPNRPRAIALGFFDGMHIGHRRLISLAVSEAKKEGLTPAVFTFFSEDERIKPGARLLSTGEKLLVMESMGIEEIIICHIDLIKNTSSEDFVLKILKDEIGAAVAVAGFNFRFGRGAAGDSQALCRLMESSGGRAVILPEVKSGEDTVSSTAVKEALATGNAERAAALLGEPYSICGEVERGLGLGESFGFPTANLPLREELLIKRGVYRTAVEIDGELYHGVTNVGICPTVPCDRTLHSETFILDFSGNVYGKKIKIYLLGFLREERKFENTKELSLAIGKDAKEGRQRNGENLWAAIGRS